MFVYMARLQSTKYSQPDVHWLHAWLLEVDSLDARREEGVRGAHDNGDTFVTCSGGCLEFVVLISVSVLRQ